MLAFAAVPAPGAQTTAADVLALLEGEGLLREVLRAPGEDARSVTLDGFGATGGAAPATLAGAWVAAAGAGFAGGMLLCDPESRGGAEPAPGRVIAVCDRPRLAFALATERFFSHLVIDRAPTWIDPVGGERAAHAGAWVMNATIGRGVTLGPHCVIGGASMGYERARTGRLVPLPQAGDVVIGDDVHLGGQASVQRGSLGTTRVGRGTKIGPHTNVAHNAQIGADVLIVGHAQVGGGARVGDGAVIGQGVVVKNGVSIGAGALIAMGTAIRYDVGPGELWSGNPAKRVGGHHGARRASPSL
jgi:acetyltransferase-like isoleucine patch superfamily enzyme